jgi:DNA-directed RNA polymerase subunit beta'
VVVRRGQEARDDQLPHDRSERDGLFCERIFGPEKDWECACGKYKGIKHKGIICDKCGVMITHSRVRRKRMGHINLAAPVAHIWFFKAMPSRLGTLLGMKTSSLERVIYFQDYVVVERRRHAAQATAAAQRGGFRQHRQKYGNSFTAAMGAEAIRELLRKMNLDELSRSCARSCAAPRASRRSRTTSKRLKTSRCCATRATARVDDPRRRPGDPAGPAPARDARLRATTRRATSTTSTGA